jgi:DnaD/phage-associated family protein
MKGWLKLAKYRMVQTDFWKDPIVLEEMTPEDKYFFLYLLTNPNTSQIGIYRITKKQMAFDLGYSIESVHSLMDRFIEHHKVIRYNPETRELAIKNWGKYNLRKGGKPVIDCIYAELKEVEDTSLIQYVLESIQKGEICSVYESFCEQKELFSAKEEINPDDHNTYLEPEFEESDDTFTSRLTIRGQKENKKEKEKQKQQQKAFNPNVENNQRIEKPFIHHLEKEDVKEINEFWDDNGFGYSNLNAKQQLLSWLNDSNFLQPKQVILKALNIACANNKRKLNYVIGILRNWENESLLTLEEIASYQDSPNTIPKHRQSTESNSCGRAIPSRFELDLTAGEE